MTSFTILTVADDGSITQEVVRVDGGEVVGRAPTGPVNRLAKTFKPRTAPTATPKTHETFSGSLAHCGAAGQM